MLVFKDRRAHPTFYIYADTLPKGAMGSIIQPPPWVRTTGAGIEATGWETKLASAARTCCGTGPIAERIEVHSHGVPGAIVLNPLVTLQNLGSFAALLSRLVRPGGMIELLCCLVAKPDLKMLNADARAKGDRRTAELCDSLGAEIDEREQEAIMGRGLVFQPKGPQPANTQTFGGLTFKPKGKRARLTAEEIIRLLEASIASNKPGDPVLETGNGPMFCAQLAARTACQVRAALGRQYEEEEEFSSADSSYKAVGVWEGHVIDFHPSGKVSYAGYDLPRPMFPQLELIGAPLGAA